MLRGTKDDYINDCKECFKSISSKLSMQLFPNINLTRLSCADLLSLSLWLDDVNRSLPHKVSQDVSD